MPCVAVRVTVCDADTGDVLAAKVALEAPDGTVTETGTNTALLLLVRLTKLLPEAGALNFTVQVSEPPPIIDEDAQLSPMRDASEDAPLPCSLTEPAITPEEGDLASTLSWPVESVVEPGS